MCGAQLTQVAQTAAVRRLRAKGAGLGTLVLL
jgi:hypothetical protein